MPHLSTQANRFVSRAGVLCLLILHAAALGNAAGERAAAKSRRDADPAVPQPQDQAATAAGLRLEVTVDVDFGDDLGQNFGSLFEAVDRAGRVVAGAGFLGAFNTNARSNRRALHFFVRPRGEHGDYFVEPLPRPNHDCGVYLHAVGADVLAQSPPGGTDRGLRVWNESEMRWDEAHSRTPYAVNVDDGLLEVHPTRIDFRGRPVLQLDEGQLQTSGHYYGNGFLVFRQFDPSATPSWNRLVARSWRAGEQAAAAAQPGHQIELRSPREFVYGMGQLHSELIVATNTGGLYRFDGKRWECLLEPDLNVSFQIYAIINYYDRLLLGQYPTGNVFEYRQGTLELRKGEPPVMNGVSPHARECQTLAIYRGDLYAGVWPWGELWRLDGDRSEWDFVRRMFPHPEPNADYQHPYERQTTELNSVLNRWGQRITSLVPRGHAMLVSTSNKSGSAYEPKFDFLADDKWMDYGRVYRIKLPGHISVPTVWTGRRTRFVFTLDRDQLRVQQDGRLLGSAEIDPDLAAEIEPQSLTWGRGIYGESPCRFAARTWRTAGRESSE